MYADKRWKMDPSRKNLVEYGGILAVHVRLSSASIRLGWASCPNGAEAQRAHDFHQTLGDKRKADRHV